MAQNNKAQALVDRVIARHGGIKLWSAVETITMHAKTGGVALPSRFKFGAFNDYQAHIRAREPHVRIIPHPKAGMQGIFCGDAVRIETEKGRPLQLGSQRSERHTISNPPAGISAQKRRISVAFDHPGEHRY